MPSDLARFLDALADDGQVRVSREAPNAGGQDAELALRAWDQTVRTDWPGTAPALEVEVALCTANVLYRACQLLVYRDSPAELVQQAFAAPLARRRDARTAYAVDLTLRFLPSLFGMARAASPGDPLTAALLELGGQWPLSSVGMPGVEPGAIDAILADPGLRQVYVDRIIERGDASRLNDPRVALAVRETIGDHPALAGKLEAVLNPSGA